jgi:hypothetical protein
MSLIYITPPNPNQQKSTQTNNPFHSENYKNLSDAWSHSLNENYWRHGIVINQGNLMNVSAERCRVRLNVIAGRLLREMFGNKYRQKGCKVHFLMASEGSKQSYNSHHHVLMAIVGDHSWSDWKIKMFVNSIDFLFCWTNGGWRGEKPCHVDYGWKEGNRYHSYSTKSIQRGSADWMLY